MSARLEQTNLNQDESFYIGIFQDTLEKSTWHYHDNYEISFITEGSGKRIVADSIEEFHPGDLVFIGRNLPHVWIADKDSLTPSSRSLEMVFLQFTDHVINSQLRLLPEFKSIVKALSASERGVHIFGQTLNKVSELMLQMPYMKSFDRILHLLKILDCIGKSDSLLHLASKEYVKSRFTSGNRRIALIHDYLMKNYREDVNLNRLASLVNMAEGSLCRYFKSNMGLTIFEYLNKVKVEFACKLLMDEDSSITDVCFNSGFRNVSHFNKQFKKITDATPREYRLRFKGLKQ